jgi:hypothetical protein
MRAITGIHLETSMRGPTASLARATTRLGAIPLLLATFAAGTARAQQTGAPQTGAPQTGAPQTGAPQTGVPQADASPPDASRSQRPAARPLGPALATSEPMGAVSAVRQLPGGRVLVNDPVRRRVVLLDSMMKTIAVVADTTAATQHAYGVQGGGLLAWTGDSTLFLDPASLSMLVLDPNGMIVRVKAAPRPEDVLSLVGGALGFPGFDAKGRLVYRATGFSFNRRGGGGGGGFQPPAIPDSAPLVRFDLATRRLDTAAFIKVNAPKISVSQTDEGRRQLSITVNPLPEVDDWAVLPDGRIAILRHDYHVDYVDADGHVTPGPKIPYDWQRLSDSAKSAIVDSARALAQRAGPGGLFQLLNGGGDAAPAAGGFPGGGFRGAFGGGGGGFGGGRGNRGGGGGDAPPPRRAAGGANRGAGGGRQVEIVAPSTLPDYRPAFANGSVRADASGDLWVRTIPTKPLAGGPEYDVIDGTGKLVERVTIPPGTTIAGFGPDGTVYLGVRDAAGVHVVRARER